MLRPMTSTVLQLVRRQGNLFQQRPLPVDDKSAELPELVDEPVRPPCPYLMVLYDRIPFCGPNMFRG
jgi:hypothetical protein